MCFAISAPNNQPPPDCMALNSSSIILTWYPPDNPNGVIEMYRLYRNGTLLATFSPNGNIIRNLMTLVIITIVTRLQPGGVSAVLLKSVITCPSIRPFVCHEMMQTR